MGKRIMLFICALMLIMGTAFGLAGCKKTSLLEEIQGIKEGVGRWDEASWDNNAKFAE